MNKTILEAIELVFNLGTYQVKKLLEPKNMDKIHWTKITMEDLFNHLQAEFVELAVAVDKGNDDEVWREAADLANIAMMIAGKVTDETVYHILPKGVASLE